VLTQKEIDDAVLKLGGATGMSYDEAREYIMSIGYVEPRVFPNGARMYLREDTTELGRPEAQLKDELNVMEDKEIVSRELLYWPDQDPIIFDKYWTTTRRK